MNEALREWMMTNGWSIIVVLAVIGVLVYFDVLNPENFTPKSNINNTFYVNTTFQDVMPDKDNLDEYSVYVCNNLELLKNNSIIIYPEIYYNKRTLDSIFPGATINIDGSKVDVRGYDKDGVTCEMLSEACLTGVYCVQLISLIPVNYTEWEQWRRENGNNG